MAEEHKDYCKSCGKMLPVVPVLNLDEAGYLSDLCTDCEFKLKYPDGPPVKYKAKYLGDYAAYPDPKDVKMITYHDHLEVPELELTIPYKELQNVQSMTKESLTATRMFLVGVLAFALKKKTLYLIITFNDVIGIEQNPVFDVFDKISEIQPFLYQQMINARMGWREL